MSREPGAMTEHVVTERDAQGLVVCTVEREITVEDLLLRKMEKDLRTYVRRCIAEVRGIPGTVGGTLRDTIPVDEAVADELTAAGVDVATVVDEEFKRDQRAYPEAWRALGYAKVVVGIRLT